MGRSKKPSASNANFEPLVGSRANSADKNSNPIQMEQYTKDLSLSCSGTGTYQSTRAARPHPRSPQSASHYSPLSTRLRRPLHRPRSPPCPPRRRSPSGSPRISTSRSYRSRSPPHRVPPRHRGVANSDYYRPSYAARTPSKSPEYKYRTLSVVSAHGPGESLDAEKISTTESWAELASRKHREWTAPAPSSPTLPDSIQESWVEMASRKHKELKVVEASKANDLAEIAPITPTKPKEARFLKERARLKEIEGLDIPESSLLANLCPKSQKARASVPFKKVGPTIKARKKDISSPPLVKVSPQRSRIHSKEPTSVLEQDIPRPKQSLLGSFPIQDFSENSYIPAEHRQTISPPKVRINIERH
ncbi:hypothetical protein DID88_003218 [Monilinia fructigena]|uniref:Uncharacterized protein n=1 Tax=Monilinia fructigena TaxID=38457 RepID=A0A395IUP7_9HELO|nr:hypothetical protein DID88_003218 [Monilinia fructigena]